MKKIYLLLFGLLYIHLSVLCQVADFILPDTVCVNQSITAQNTTIGGSGYYWNFCSGNLGTSPIGINMGNLGSLSRPVYSSIAKDGDNYFVFITNNSDGSLTRLAFGNSLTNIPLSTNLGNLGIMGPNVEGIQIKRDPLTGNWYGLVTWWRIDNLVRLNFGNSLINTPTAENLGNIDNSLSYAHTIYTFYESGSWYSFIVNNGNSTIIRLNFGSSLSNFPTATNLGNIGGLNGPVGLYPIQENGIWYLFIVNRDGNTLSRLEFGNSLLNTPIGFNLGDVGGTMHYPRSVAFLKDCGKVFGFVVNEATNDIVRLTFPNGLLSSPSAISLGNIANFSFPHHISELFRVGDSLYAFITNVTNNTISRLCFASCNKSSVPSSNLQNPTAFSYNSPGSYNVSLVVNEGQPDQSNICKEVVVIGPTIPIVTGDTTLCNGEPLNLISSTVPGGTYLWTGPNGYSSSRQNLSIPLVNSTHSGKYILTVSGCANVAVTRNVIVTSNPTVTGDTLLCVGETINLAATSSSGNTYLWNGPNGFSSTSQNLSIPNAGITNAGKYTLTLNGCINGVTRNISVVTSPTVTGNTELCAGDTLKLVSSATAGSTSLWSGPNGFTSTTHNLTIPSVDDNNTGTYTLTIGSCQNTIVRKIINVKIAPVVNLGNDTIICHGSTIIMDAGNTGNNYQWNTGADSQTITIETPGDYAVVVLNGVCSASDDIFIGDCGTGLWFPNVFSPNNDGLNERFKPVSIETIGSYQILIFNRWGQQLYESNDAYAGWDGTFKGGRCPEGVYYYIAEYSLGAQTSSSDQRVKRGAVTVLR